MSVGTQKGLDNTAAAKPADHPAPTQPKWDVSHREVLNQIKQDRNVAHPEVRTAAAVPPHREVQQQQQQPRPRAEMPHPQVAAPVARPDVQRQHPEIRQPNNPTSGHRADVTPTQQIAQTHPIGNQQLGQPQPFHGRRDTQTPSQSQTHPTEINRTIINNNQRYEYGSNGQNYANNNNNNLKYLYGGLAGGALLGGAAGYYANRDYNYNQNYGGYNNYDAYRNWNTVNQYNQYNQYDQYNQYGLNQYDQYGLNQYDQYRYPNGNLDSSYLNGYANNFDPNYDGTYNSNSDYLYGGTTYGSTQFDSGYNAPPIYETTVVQPYQPIYRDTNPIAAIPQLFGNLIGGVLGSITSSHHHRRYYGTPFDC